MSDLLTIADVMQHYQCTRQTASKIMHKVPVKKIAGKLFVASRDLMEWEESRTEYPAVRTKRTAVQAVAMIPRRRA